MSRVCHVYVGCNTVRMNILQKVIVVESQSAIHTTPKNTPFIFKRAPKGNNVQVQYNTVLTCSNHHTVTGQPVLFLGGTIYYLLWRTFQPSGLRK